MTMTIDPLSILSASLWGVYVAWKEFFPYVRRSPSNGNGPAGDKSADYWKLEMRAGMLELLHSALGPKFDAQINLLTEVKNSTNEVSKGVAELVTLGRAQQQGRRR
jgi:hypothetical protein